MRILRSDWKHVFEEEIAKSNRLKFISPFLGETTINVLLKEFTGNAFQLVTRFKQEDFAIGVSSIRALKKLIKRDVQIYGYKGLHSKVYIFDERAAVVTSANLTEGGLENNEECGVYITEKEQITQFISYFNELKATNESPLTIDECEKWEREIEEIKRKNDFEKPNTKEFKDYGAEPGLFNPNVNYFLKFLGHSGHRVGSKFSTKEEIDRALCHYALGFPRKSRPKSVKDGDVIFICRMTHTPNDNMIFGRAIAKAFRYNEDMASKEEIENRPWMEKWPSLLKVFDAKFIDGQMSEMISLHSLMEELKYLTFSSTKENYEKGDGNLVPSKSIMQKAYIQLTKEAALWLEKRFHLKLKAIGSVDESFIDSLPVPEGKRIKEFTK
jgi:HKD family nuclease